MTPLTLFLAKLFGTAFLIFGVMMAVRKEALITTSERIIRDPGMVLLFGSLRLVIGLAIVIGHDVWSGGVLPPVITLLGWFTLLRGLILLFAPSNKLFELYRSMRFEQNYAYYAAGTGLIGLYLLVAGFAG